MAHINPTRAEAASLAGSTRVGQMSRKGSGWCPKGCHRQFSGAASVPLRSGLLKTYAKNMKTHQRGFIPLVVVLLRGLVVTAGGTAAYISIHQKSSVPAGDATTSDNAILEETSEPQERPAAIEEEVTVTPIEQVLVVASMSPRTEEICKEAANEDIPEAPSLIGQILTLCRELEKPVLNSVEQQEKWFEIEASIADKNELWQTAKEREEVAEQRCLNIKENHPDADVDCNEE